MTTKLKEPASGGGSVDQDEIARFQAMADNWWDPEGDFKPLLRMTPVRMGNCQPVQERDGIPAA